MAHSKRTMAAGLVLPAVLALLLSLSPSLAAAAAAVPRAPARSLRKQLAGPAAEFASRAVPLPASAAVRADSGFLPVTFAPQAGASGKYVWTGVLDVDSDAEFSLSVLSPHAAKLEVSLQPPNWDSMTLLTPEMFEGGSAVGRLSSGPFGYDGASFPSLTYTFPDPVVG